jgi:hypothetical protein
VRIYATGVLPDRKYSLYYTPVKHFYAKEIAFSNMAEKCKHYDVEIADLRLLQKAATSCNLLSGGCSANRFTKALPTMTASAPQAATC